jgi:hypothetical protein
MNNELKPCPLCGCTPTFWESPKGFGVMCKNCELFLPGFSIDSVRELWNKRKSVDKTYEK